MIFLWKLLSQLLSNLTYQSLLFFTVGTFSEGPELRQL
jgi:hypothetical protein